MNHLPASIEEHLREAGLSDMEVLLLRHMLDGDGFSIRELAAKMGKSTGALDQAMKKLLQKKIVSKEIVNKAPKYRLDGTDALGKFLQSHTAKAVKALKRREQDFDAFISSISIGSTRPDIEYFDGVEGIKQAYTALLSYADGKDMLQYFPVKYREDEDPLRAFRVEHFRERRRLGIFLRVLTHETPLGKRFLTRDAFEFRKTLFVSPKRCPLEFEQIICGDTFTCIDYEEERACIIRFPKLASSERSFFENAWEEAHSGSPVSPATQHDAQIPSMTKFLSSLREFFLGRNSIIALGVCALLSAVCTYGLYQNNFQINKERSAERAKAIAIENAQTFDPADLQELQQESDYTKPEWGKVVHQLVEIREIMTIYFLHILYAPQRITQRTR